MQTRLFDERVAILSEDAVHMWVTNDKEIATDLRGSHVYSWGKEIMKRNNKNKSDFENQVRKDYEIEKIEWSVKTNE